MLIKYTRDSISQTLRFSVGFRPLCWCPSIRTYLHLDGAFFLALTADRDRKDELVPVLFRITAEPENAYERFNALAPYALVRTVAWPPPQKAERPILKFRLGSTLPLRGPHGVAFKQVQLALRVINLHCEHLDLHETRMTTGSLRPSLSKKRLLRWLELRMRVVSYYLILKIAMNMKELNGNSGDRFERIKDRCNFQSKTLISLVCSCLPYEGRIESSF